MDSSKQPSNIGRNPVASPFASDDQFYGAGLWDFPFVRFKDMALSKILFRFRCHYSIFYIWVWIYGFTGYKNGLIPRSL